MTKGRTRKQTELTVLDQRRNRTRYPHKGSERINQSVETWQGAAESVGLLSKAIDKPSVVRVSLLCLTLFHNPY